MMSLEVFFFFPIGFKNTVLLVPARFWYSFPFYFIIFIEQKRKEISRGLAMP